MTLGITVLAIALAINSWQLFRQAYRRRAAELKLLDALAREKRLRTVLDRVEQNSVAWRRCAESWQGATVRLLQIHNPEAADKLLRFMAQANADVCLKRAMAAAGEPETGGR